MEQQKQAHEVLVAAHEVEITYETSEGHLFRAIENVSFQVRRGEKFVLIGPSGCGKSTLLKAIAGFQPISGGELSYNGQAINSAGPDRTVVFQEFDQLFPWQTVQSNLTYALKVAKGIKGKAAQERAGQMLQLVGIEEAAQKYPHQLSGGMKMRAAIARALALEPTILLMDEPFAALDEITRNQLQLELNEIWRRTKVTIILVTHSIQEAVFLGQRVMVMTAAPALVRQIVDTSTADSFESTDFTRYNQHLRSLLIQPHALVEKVGS